MHAVDVERRSLDPTGVAIWASLRLLDVDIGLAERCLEELIAEEGVAATGRPHPPRGGDQHGRGRGREG
jgi:hypothetical protein